MYLAELSTLLTSQTALLGLVGLGTMMAVVGAARAFSGRTSAAGRMALNGRVSARGPARAGGTATENKSLVGSIMPDSREERFAVSIALARAGFRGPKAVAGFYIARFLLGAGLPAILLLFVVFSRSSNAPLQIAGIVNDLSTMGLAQIACVLCAVGFFGPSIWLRGKIAERRQAITEAFPNALDLIQIGVEAGLGFDQALLKVATEIQTVAPELSEEILLAQNEIQAGRDREHALMHMARRTGVDEVASFVNVVLQSARFGTPMSDALRTYAEEMRLTRELKAQEKANKLPVQMSGVMASLMLPAILLLTLGPVVIRYLDYFANGPTAV
ncbi:MAG: type II secretion system F family protein [Pseudomonadota bacterium]